MVRALIYLYCTCCFFLTACVSHKKPAEPASGITEKRHPAILTFTSPASYKITEVLNHIPPFDAGDSLVMLHHDGMKQFKGSKLDNHYAPIPERLHVVNGKDTLVSLLYYLETENKAYIVRKNANRTEWLFTKAYLQRHQLPKYFNEEEWELCYLLEPV